MTARNARHIVFKPSMGRRPDEYRFLLNLVPRRGTLKRRPALVALDYGHSDTNLQQNEDTGAWAATDMRSVGYNHRIIEGVDIEVVKGKIVMLYLYRTPRLNAPNDDYIQLGWSWHMASDLRFSGGVAGSSKVISSVDIDGGGSSSGHHHPGLHRTIASSFWKKRIHKCLNYMMITGHGAGYNFPVGGAVTADTDVHSAGDILLWNIDSLKMMGAPVDSTRNSSGNLVKVDPFSTIYCAHPPRNAFAHTDRLGQTIWFGFVSGQNYTLDSTLPDDQVLLTIPNINIISDPNGDKVVVEEFTVWYSEGDEPVTLPVAGCLPVRTGVDSPEVVGLAEYRGGTICFTKDSVQYLQGVGSDGNDLSRQIVSRGIGAGSRWSIKEVADGVAFANKDGLFHLSERTPQRLEQFDELFGDGMDMTNGPYQTYSDGSDGSTVGGPEAGITSESGKIYTAQTKDVTPWRRFRVDEKRLDRALGVVWDDLYILFCSNAGDASGDDNRLALVWNWKENSTAVWYLPTNMGVRGWAYNNEVSVPYVMTRYGPARFELDTLEDLAWDGDTATATPSFDDVTSSVPVAIAGQTHLYPETGDAVVIANALIHHTVRMNEGIDDNYKMKVSMWSHTSDISIGQSEVNTTQVCKSESGALQNLYQGTFNAWRMPLVTGSDYHLRAFTGLAATNHSHRIGDDIRRVSISRSGGSAVRHRMQFFTLQPADILITQIGIIGAAPKGGRS